MITSLLLKRQSREVARLSVAIHHERRVLNALRQEARAGLESHLRGGWALAGCFSAGFLTGRFGGRAVRAVRTLPVMRLARQLWAHLLV
ncbi:hypothetical protein OOT55_03055 [Marinimicrobium sp. C6131]|uniref:hypothetical protein n=1 Tax=Marinimicrobium sp. C6131 TaxID=3022676 RepID=UPI00223E0092|nr:hypothetical protein [Marinimicrobium sp. C6131]UZJ45050.1 hypothetical protein OOT55_03055 [Marinimicrobium sp. C6131]